MEAVKPACKSCRAGGLKLASAACTGLLGAMGTAAASAGGHIGHSPVHTPAPAAGLLPTQRSEETRQHTNGSVTGQGTQSSP